ILLDNLCALKITDGLHREAVLFLQIKRTFIPYRTPTNARYDSRHCENSAATVLRRKAAHNMNHYMANDMKRKTNDAAHILVVEDNDNDQWLLAVNVASKMRNAFDYVSTAKEALAYLKDKTPILVLLDLG